MSDDIKWFKIQCIYPVKSGLTDIEEEDEEDPVLRRIRLKSLEIDSDEFEYDYAYIDLIVDPIANLTPCCVVPKNAKNKKYYTDIVLQSGNVIHAVGKPELIFEKLMEHTKSSS